MLKQFYSQVEINTGEDIKLFVLSEWADIDVDKLYEYDEFKNALPLYTRPIEYSWKMTAITLKEILVKTKNNDKIIPYPLPIGEIENIQDILLNGGDYDYYKTYNAFVKESGYHNDLFYYDNDEYVDTLIITGITEEEKRDMFGVIRIAEQYESFHGISR